MSLQSGQYNNPLVRPTFAQAPIIAAFAALRLRADLQFSGTGTQVSMDDNLVLATFENTGLVSVTAQLRQVGDYASGLPSNGTLGTIGQTAPFRSNIGAAFLLAPKGRKTLSFTPTQQYIELWGVSGGPSDVRCQFNSQLPLTKLGFAKDDPTYPTQLWEPPNL